MSTILDALRRLEQGEPSGVPETPAPKDPERKPVRKTSRIARRSRNAVAAGLVMGSVAYAVMPMLLPRPSSEPAATREIDGDAPADPSPRALPAAAGQASDPGAGLGPAPPPRNLISPALRRGRGPAALRAAGPGSAPMGQMPTGHSGAVGLQAPPSYDSPAQLPAVAMAEEAAPAPRPDASSGAPETPAGGQASVLPEAERSVSAEPAPAELREALRASEERLQAAEQQASVSAESVLEEAEETPPEESEKTLDDDAVFPYFGADLGGVDPLSPVHFPPLRILNVRWHPQPDRRGAILEIDRAGPIDVQEGDIIAGVLIRKIDPAAIEAAVGSEVRIFEMEP